MKSTEERFKEYYFKKYASDIEESNCTCWNCQNNKKELNELKPQPKG